MRGHNVFDLNNLKFGVVVSDFSDFAKEELCAVVRQVMSSNVLAPNEWKCVVKENSDNEIRTFYSKPRYYTYEIMRPYLQPEKFRKKEIFAEIVRSLRNMPETGNVLEFGGGTGQLCLVIFFNTNHNVSYADIPGKIFEFAGWRFRKYNADIKMIPSSVDRIDLGDMEYDAVICDAVLEHLIPKYAKGFIEVLVSSLKENGIFICLYDSASSPQYPYHIGTAVNIKGLLRNNGLVRVNEITFVKSRSLGVLLKHLAFLTKRILLAFSRLLRKLENREATSIPRLREILLFLTDY